MIRRLYELQAQQPRDADAWLWSLWLDPADYPVDIRRWILRRLDDALTTIKAVGDDADEIDRQIGLALKHRRLTNKLSRRGINPSQIHDLVAWAYRVAADFEQHERLDNPGSPIFDTLRRVSGIPEKGFPPPTGKSSVESIPVDWLHKVVLEASAEELEQLRRDCRAITRLAELAASIDWRTAHPAMKPAIRAVVGGLPEPPSVRARKNARKRTPVPSVARFIISLWHDFDIRAIMASGVIAFRQSPEVSKRLDEILPLSIWGLELAAAKFPPQPPR
jgi:hypothetical protein